MKVMGILRPIKENGLATEWFSEQKNRETLKVSLFFQNY